MSHASERARGLRGRGDIKEEVKGYVKLKGRKRVEKGG